MRNENVSFQTRRVSRDGGNLLLSGTVSIGKIVMVFKIIIKVVLTGLMHASQVCAFSIWFSLKDFLDKRKQTALQHFTQNPTMTIKTPDNFPVIYMSFFVRLCLFPANPFFCKFNPLTPVPAVTSPDKPWPFFHF